MKKLIYLVLLLAISCSSNSQVLIKKMEDPVLTEILVFSEVIDLNEHQLNIEKNLWLKVYKLPNTESNKCFPESHGICTYKYYIATSQLDDSPIFNVYYLGSLGEIIDYKWELSSSVDKAVINIITNKYSKEALDYNELLDNKITSYQIIATPNNLIINEIKQ